MPRVSTYSGCGNSLGPVSTDGPAPDRAPVSTDASVPPYLQIVNWIRKQIRTGELPPGSQLPAQAKLAQRFGVAQSTAVHAIRELQYEGLVIGQQGRGTFVRSAPADEETRAATIESLTRQVGRLRDDLRAVHQRVRRLEEVVGLPDETGEPR
jgi:GntR family transcriptional regulator